MTWRLNSCREHRVKLSLLASDRLPEPEQAPVRAHLALCDSCRNHYAELANLTDELQRWARMEVPVQAGAAFPTRWMRCVHAADAPAQGSFVAQMFRWGDWLWPSPVAWGALAGVWVCLLSLQWAAPVQSVTAQAVAAHAPNRATIIFAQRQRELASLLESLAPTPAPAKPDQPRPRTQRHLESLRT
jgi:anti-sigma factor RsiW